VKRAPIALLAALVTGMALVAGGIVGDHYGFREWPMSPAPQSAQHVTVSHPKLATYSPEKRAHEPSPATHAAESADNSLPAGSARGATHFVTQRRTVRAHHSVPRHGSSSSTPNYSDDSDGGSADDGSTNHPTTQTSTTPTATTPAPSGSEVSAASASTPQAATPATSDPAPADPQPVTPAPAPPAPPADPSPAPQPPTTGGGKGGQGSGGGRHHGPVGQLLHDLLGLGNVQD
jgi:hypothetical protein